MIKLHLAQTITASQSCEVTSMAFPVLCNILAVKTAKLDTHYLKNVIPYLFFLSLSLYQCSMCILPYQPSMQNTDLRKVQYFLRTPQPLCICQTLLQLTF